MFTKADPLLQVKSYIKAVFGYNLRLLSLCSPIMLEIELKFQIHDSRRSALLKALDPKKSTQIKLQAKYYDTPEQHLATAKAALRQRLEGNTWVQTFKASKNHLERFEHNAVLGELTQAPELDLRVYEHDAEAAALFQHAVGGHADALELQFETDIQRTLRVIEFQDSEIEVSLDIGEIRAKGRQQPVHEIEFELKRGSVQDLLAFSFEWVKKYQLWLDVRSKAEFGHLLAANHKVSPAKVAKPFLALKKHSPDHNVRMFVAQQLQHLLPHIAAISADVAEVEHVQQAHQALKQLYLTVTVFKTWSTELSDRWSSQLAAFLEQFEQRAHLEQMQQRLVGMLQNPNTALSLQQDLLFAKEKLSQLVRSTQNVHHFLELLSFSFTQQADNTVLKTAAQTLLQQQYKQLFDALQQNTEQEFAHLDHVSEALDRLHFSFPILTQIYDVKNLQKYAKTLQDAQRAAEEYRSLSRSIAYIQDTELNPSDWFVLGWLTAKQELYAERVTQAAEQFLLSRKLLK